MDELTKIDLIRERLDVSYAEANEALEKAGGDVVAALIELERELKRKNVWTSMKDLLTKCSRMKFHLKKNHETVLTAPLPLGVAALVGVLSNDDLALAAGLGVALGVLKGYHLELEDEQQETDEFIVIS